MYQSEWTKKPVLHLFPHWNWLPGQQIDMWCYYNQADEVELFINGKSQGIRKKKVHGEENGAAANAVSANSANAANAGAFDHSTEYHVMWRVNFEPGEVKVVARKQGREISSQTIKTAGPPHHLVLKKTYQNTLASGVLGDLQSPSSPTTFVEVNVVDKDGNLCPNAENEIYFSSTAEILGTDNGNQTSLERFTDPKRKAFFGKCIIVLRGHGTLRAESIDLQQATLQL